MDTGWGRAPIRPTPRRPTPRASCSQKRDAAKGERGAHDEREPESQNGAERRKHGLQRRLWSVLTVRRELGRNCANERKGERRGRCEPDDRPDARAAVVDGQCNRPGRRPAT